MASRSGDVDGRGDEVALGVGDAPEDDDDGSEDVGAAPAFTTKRNGLVAWVVLLWVKRNGSIM